MPSCRMLAPQDDRRDASRAVCTAGRSRATRMPMMAMTTSSSTSVNARRRVWMRIGPPTNSGDGLPIAPPQFRPQAVSLGRDYMPTDHRIAIFGSLPLQRHVGRPAKDFGIEWVVARPPRHARLFSVRAADGPQVHPLLIFAGERPSADA